MAQSSHEGLYDALLLEIAAARAPAVVEAARSGPIALFLRGLWAAGVGSVFLGAVVLTCVAMVSVVISAVGEAFGAWGAESEPKVALVVLAAGVLAALWQALPRLGEPDDKAGYDTALQVMSRLGPMVDSSAPMALKVEDALGKKQRGWRWVMSVPTSGAGGLTIEAEGDRASKSLKASGWPRVDGLGASVRASGGGWVDAGGRSVADPAVAVAAALTEQLRGVGALSGASAFVDLEPPIRADAPREPEGSFEVAASLEPDLVSLPGVRVSASSLLSNALYWGSPLASAAFCVAMVIQGAETRNALIFLCMAAGAVLYAASDPPLSPFATTRQPRRRAETTRLVYDATSGVLSLGAARVDLGAPFAVHLTRQASRADLLGVEVVSGRDRLRCRVPVARSAFVDALPMLELGDAPLIAADDFARAAWPALRWRAALQGPALGAASIRATPSMATPPVATPSAATLSAATPGTTTPSAATPSVATPGSTAPGATAPGSADEGEAMGAASASGASPRSARRRSG